ncbi:sugar transporter-like protein [Rhodotorula kratochvilovae]
MSLVNDKQRHEGEKREFTHSSPAPSHDGPVAKKGGFQGTSMPEGTSLDASGMPTYMGANGNKLGALVTICASMGFILYDQGVMSGIISAPQFISVFPACDPAAQGTYKASVLQAFYVAIYEIGCLGGAIFALMFGDRLGRRKMMFTGAVVLILGVIIQITAFRGSWAGGQFIIGRIITGLGTGFETSTIPTWHAECAKAHSRGFAVFIEAAMISTGTMVSYWVDLGFSYIDSSVSWRVPIALQCIFAIGLILMLIWLPESPRWLISKGHMTEGQRVVAALEPAPFDSETVILQVKVIADSLEGQIRQRKRDLITNGPTQHFRRMLLGSSSQFFQQVGGCNAVIYFSTPIFEEYLGQSRQMALILGSVLATVYALSACISFPLVDKVGRRKLYFIGTIGQAVSMFIIMGCLIPGKDSNATNGAVVGIFLFLTFFGFTWLELPWLYPAEINPLKTRTNANAVSTINNWLWNFTVVMFTPPFLASTAVGCFAFFGAINLCFLPVIHFYYIETAGRSLEEIDVIFARGYVEGVSYVKMAKEMPRLSGAEIEAEWQRLGLSDEARPQSAMGSVA